MNVTDNILTNRSINIILKFYVVIFVRFSGGIGLMSYGRSRIKLVILLFTFYRSRKMIL